MGAGIETQQCKYATLAVLELARAYKSHQPTSIQKIATKYEFSQAFLAQVFRQLRENKLVEPIRGPLGGYRLIPSPEEITIGYVISLLSRAPKKSTPTKVDVATPAERDRRKLDQIFEEAETYKQRYLNSVSYADLLEESQLPSALDFSI